MNVDQSISTLTEMFKGKDWFFDVGVDEFSRLVVYVNYMCSDTLYNIPPQVDGTNVLVHFADAYKATREQYTTSTRPTLLDVMARPIKEKLEQQSFASCLVVEDAEEVIFPNGLQSLVDELDRLEKLCNSNLLQDIFFEVHDGDNAVTNLSAKYPEVRESMDVLYKQYGFDVIYEELDG